MTCEPTIKRKRHPVAKVGEDCVFQYDLRHPITGAPLTIDSATMTIVDPNGTRVVDNAAAVLVAANIAEFVWTAPTPLGVYLVEWHLVHSGTVDRYADTEEQEVIDRLAA